jgi:hypothetical protein
MKKASVLIIVILAATILLTVSTQLTSATYSEGVTIVINSDGSVTPSSAPVSAAETHTSLPTIF